MRHFYIALSFCLCAVPALKAHAQDSTGFGPQGFNRSAPVEVAAESLEVLNENGQALLKGDVIIGQDSLRLTAQEVIIRYTENKGERQITRMTATGNVLITAGDDAVEGGKAIYDLTANTIYMSQDVLLVQKDITLAGQEMEIDLTTGQASLKGRVRTTFGASGSQ